MHVFIFGLSGAIGGLLARRLRARGDDVSGLVRTPDQQQSVAAQGISSVRGDLSTLSVDDLAEMASGMDAIVYSAGSNGGSRDATAAIDRDGVERAAEAARRAGVPRFILVSVMPESWRERDLEDDVEYYFAVKKQTDARLTRTDLDWVILRPSLLTDEPGTGCASVGPAEIHNQISREDVASILDELVHERRIRRQILEADAGDTRIARAVRENIRR